MEITIKNILGVDRQYLELKPKSVTEVIGPNACGKTSIALSVQALLTHDANPLGLSAADRVRYAREGSSSEDAVAELDGHDVVWRPGAGTITASPDRQPLLPEAVGLVDFTGKRSARERAESLQHVLLPPLDQLLTDLEVELRKWLPEEDAVRQRLNRGALNQRREMLA